jgi:hypothetical protein
MARVHGLGGEGSTQAIGTPRWVTTDRVRGRDRLLLAAPADTGAGFPITDAEAAILGWIAGDGHIETRRYRPTMSIAQSKPQMLVKLHELLADVPHAEYIDGPRPTRTGAAPIGPRHQFRLDYEWASRLVDRVGHPKLDAIDQVLGMSISQRLAWLEAIIDGEGHVQQHPEKGQPQVSISQTLGPVHDAIVLAVYLTGNRPRVLPHTRGHERWSDSDSIHPNLPIVTGDFLHREDAGHGPAWCAATDLGTWTIEQDGHAFLTGALHADSATATNRSP